MQYRIYREGKDDAFVDTGDVFDDGGDASAISRHLAELQAADGVCRSAMYVTDAPAATLPPAGRVAE